MEERKHHEFSPSRLEQYRICSGAYKMQIGLPSEVSVYAEEGTRLHKAVETGDMEGLSAEQVNAVNQCIEFRESLARENKIAEYHSEEPVTVMSGDEVLTYGTVDAVMVCEGSGKAIAIDWKFGYTPVKSVDNNMQLAAYAAGIMDTFKGVTEVECHVFQPRILSHSSYTFRNHDAIVSNIRRIVDEARGDVLKLNATDESCRYCKARLNCPAFRLKYQRFTACAQTIDINNPDSVSQAYAEAESVQKFIKTLEEKVREFIERDGRCGQYGFKVTDGNRMIADINKCYERVKDYVTLGEFNTVCTLAVGKFETLIAGKMKASAEAMGEKLTVAESKKKAIGLVEDLVSRETPTKRIVKLEE